MATRISSPTLVGRHAELRQLQEALERATAGQPGVALVAGEAGVGKTRLVDELAGWARQRGTQILNGGCVSLSADVAPFAAIVDALRPLTRHVGPQELEAIAGPHAYELAALLPELVAVPPPTGTIAIPHDTSHGRLLEMLLGMLGRLAARAPLLLIIEDIQWADRSTVDVLAYVARNLRSERVLLVATFRTDEPHARGQLLPFIAELGRSDRAERIDLQPLNRAEVAEQLGAILGTPAASRLTDQVFARSQGNAFFSEELLAAESVSGTLPQTLRDVLTARLGVLSVDARELVRVASAAGRAFSESLLAQIAQPDDRAFRESLREALAHQILVRVPSGGAERIAFRHALMQEILYEDLLPSERTRLHAACARAIEERLSGSSDAILASELAYHWQAADEPERALRASIAAGLAAESARARTEAAVQFERALTLMDELPGVEADLPLDRVELLERAAANLERHDPDRAVEHVTEALRLVPSDRDPEKAGMLRAALGRYLWAKGDGAAALVACREAVALVPQHPPTVARARVTAGLGQILMILGYAEEGVGYSQEAVAIASRTGARGIESHALNTLGILTAYLGDTEKGLVMLRQSLEIAEEISSIDGAARAYANMTDVLIFTAGRYDEAGDIGVRAIGPPDAPSFSGVPAAILHSNIVLAFYLAGRWDEAAATLHRARQQPASGIGEIALEIRAAQLAVGRGAFEMARPQIDALLQRLEGAEDEQWVAPLVAAQAELEIWRNHPAAALEAVADGLERVHLSLGTDMSRIGPLLALGVRAAADLAQPSRRRRPVESLEAALSQGGEHLAAMRALHDEVATRWPAHLWLARPYLAICEAEATRLSGGSDPEAWAKVASCFEDLPQPYVRAYARYREGEALLAARHGAQRARSVLQESHAIARSLDAAPLRDAVEAIAQRGRVELHDPAGGAEPSAARFGLSAREQEILGLVAAGMTNREIGERLFITEKTAGHHVSNVLAKLGVSRRAEAAAEAIRLGIGAPGA